MTECSGIVHDVYRDDVLINTAMKPRLIKTYYGITVCAEKGNMDNINYTSFKAFVMAQDESRTIDHRGWDTCSVGDYMRNIEAEGFISWHNVSKALCDHNAGLRELLNHSRRNNMPTYKELQAVLTNYEEGKL